VHDIGLANPVNNLNCWLKSSLFQANEQCAGNMAWRQDLSAEKRSLLNTVICFLNYFILAKLYFGK